MGNVGKCEAFSFLYPSLVSAGKGGKGKEGEEISLEISFPGNALCQHVALLFFPGKSTTLAGRLSCP